MKDAGWGLGYAGQLEKDSCISTLEAIAKISTEYAIASALGSSCGQSASAGCTAAFSAEIQAAITIGCSIDYNKSACGSPQLAWLIPGAAGKAAGDLIALEGVACSVNPGGPVCLGVAIYQLANQIYSFLYSLFGWGPPQFDGSLLPRPGDLGGLGTAPIGIPNQNLTVEQLLGLPTKSLVPSPTPMVQ